MSPAGAERKRTAALAAAVFFLALLPRLWSLGRIFPVNDELMQFHEALAPGGARAFLEALARNPHHALLDPLATRLMAAVSREPWALRLPSAIAGAAGPAALVLLGGPAALAAGLLLALSPLHLDWSRRADFYALLTLLSIWSSSEFLRLFERPARWPRLAAAALAFLLSHPYAVLMGAFQLAFAARASERREALPAAAKAWGAAALLHLPWFLYSTRAMLDLGMYDYRRDPAALGLGRFLAEAFPALALRPEAGVVPAWAAWAAGAALAVGWAASLRAALRGEGGRALAFAHAVLPFGTAAVVAADLAYSYFFAHRQLLWLLPFLLLATADGWARLLRGAPAWAPRAALGAALLASLAVNASTTRWQAALGAGMAGLMERLEARAEDRDALHFTDDHVAAAFLWHFDREGFRALPGLRMAGGMLRWDMPKDFFASRGGRLHPLGSAEGPCVPKRDGWMICGSLYDMTVLPPER